jgi:hypothetical protein
VADSSFCYRFLRRVDPDQATYNAKWDVFPGKNNFATLHFISRSRLLGLIGGKQYLKQIACRLSAFLHKREMLNHRHLIGNAFRENTDDDADMAIYRQ